MSYFPVPAMWPASRLISTLSILTDEPAKLARAVMFCNCSPASLPGPKRKSAFPLMAPGIPLIRTLPETSDWVSPMASRVCLFSGNAPSIAAPFARSRVASIDALLVPARGATTVNCTPPPLACSNRPLLMRNSSGVDARLAFNDPRSFPFTRNEPSSA